MASEVPGRKLEADSESSPELKPKPAGLSRVRVYSYVTWITPTFKLFQIVSSLDVVFVQVADTLMYIYT